MNAVIIVAAGSSRRMGFDKLFASWRGKPVLTHSLQTFADCGAFSRRIVVASADGLAAVADLAGSQWQVIAGGAERHRSVANGLAVLADDCEYVAVHDGARPAITDAQIHRCLDAARQHGAAASAHRIADTVKRADADGRVIESVDRTNLWAMETPQVFRRDLLQRAYTKVLADNLSVTDEVSAVEHLGAGVQLVENDSPNPKITYPGDLQT